MICSDKKIIHGNKANALIISNIDGSEDVL
mgnify:CR=1 FL=1